ncbi:MAG TPA: hypothetical protein VGR00_04320 [Thermoanaerobaculia bacterium]|nr:hypothetical protein [Thermoanaerobaculia bacterium]
MSPAAAPRKLGDVKLKVSRQEAEKKLREADGTSRGADEADLPEREEPRPPREKRRGGVAPVEHLDVDGRGEAYWRSRAGRLRGELSAAEAELKSLEKTAEAYDRANPPGGNAAMQTWARELMRLRNEVDRARARVAVLKRRQEDLAEEARKADAYPGWLR